MPQVTLNVENPLTCGRCQFYSELPYSCHNERGNAANCALGYMQGYDMRDCSYKDCRFKGCKLDPLTSQDYIDAAVKILSDFIDNADRENQRLCDRVEANIEHIDTYAIAIQHIKKDLTAEKAKELLRAVDKLKIEN